MLLSALAVAAVIALGLSDGRWKGGLRWSDGYASLPSCFNGFNGLTSAGPGAASVWDQSGGDHRILMARLLSRAPQQRPRPRKAAIIELAVFCSSGSTRLQAEQRGRRGCQRGAGAGLKWAGGAEVKWVNGYNGGLDDHNISDDLSTSVWGKHSYHTIPGLAVSTHLGP